MPQPDSIMAFDVRLRRLGVSAVVAPGRASLTVGLFPSAPSILTSEAVGIHRMKLFADIYLHLGHSAVSAVIRYLSLQSIRLSLNREIGDREIRRTATRQPRTKHAAQLRAPLAPTNPTPDSYSTDPSAPISL